MPKADIDNPFKGIHWKTALSVGGVLLACFSLVAGIWTSTDAKIDDLKTAQLEDSQRRIEKLEGVETSLATTAEKLRVTETTLSDIRTRYEEVIGQNFEQKYRAEVLRTSALTSEMEALKAAVTTNPAPPGQEKTLSDLREKLAIVEKERDELRTLYTEATSKAKATTKPTATATPTSSRQTSGSQSRTGTDNQQRGSATPSASPKPTGTAVALKAAVKTMMSDDARDAIISGVKSAGSVQADDLADMLQRLFSSDRLKVIKETSTFIQRPIGEKQLQRLTSGMMSSDATKAVQELVK